MANYKNKIRKIAENNYDKLRHERKMVKGKLADWAFINIGEIEFGRRPILTYKDCQVLYKCTVFEELNLVVQASIAKPPNSNHRQSISSYTV